MRILRFYQILIIAFLFVACADAEKEEIKFIVISYTNSFSGLYMVDGGNSESFSGTHQGNQVYLYEKKVDVDDQIEIEASPSDTSGDDATTSLAIKVYRDGSLVKSAQDSDGNIDTIRLIYSTGEAAEETD